MKFIRRLFSLLCFASLVLACEKDVVEGPIGPQGPKGEQGQVGPEGPAGADGEAQGVPGPQGEQGAQGPAGSQGEQGAQGPSGQDGEAGTANVIYSDWVPSPFNFNPNNTLSSNSFIIAPGLTDDIRDTGAVIVYGRSSGGSTYQLPAVLFDRNQSYSARPGTSFNLRLIVESIDSGVIGQSLLLVEFRYIILPGGIPDSGKSASVDYTKMTYEEIAEHFNIPD